MVYEQLSDKLAGAYEERPCLLAGGRGAPEGPAPSAVDPSIDLRERLKAKDSRF
jgi:hypothetical protein